MTLTADRNTFSRDGKKYSYPMAATTHLYAGQMIALNSAGNAEAATLATGKIIVGRATQEVNNTGDAAAKSIEVESGVFEWTNYGGITKASIGDTVYVRDDASVQASGAGTSPVGIMVDIDSAGVWVQTGAAVCIGSAGLLAANNLSDVGLAATAATNLGLGTGDSPTFVGLTLTGGITVALTLAVTGETTFKQKLSVKTNTYTVDVPGVDGAAIIQDATDGAVITLPNAAAANKGHVVTVQNIGTSGACGISISPHSSDKIQGSVMAVASGGVADKDWINTKGTSVKGDFTTLVSDGTDTWWIIGGQGVWASE